MGDHPPLDVNRIVEISDRHRVRYLLVGGIAARLHGATRLTEDVDVLMTSDEKVGESGGGAGRHGWSRRAKDRTPQSDLSSNVMTNGVLRGTVWYEAQTNTRSDLHGWGRSGNGSVSLARPQSAGGWGTRTCGQHRTEEALRGSGWNTKGPEPGPLNQAREESGLISRKNSSDQIERGWLVK